MYRYIIAALCISSLLVPASLLCRDTGASGTDKESEATGNGWFKLYNEGWTLRPNGGFKKFSFSLLNTDTGREIRYTPNVNLGLGCKFVYKAFGLGFTAAVPNTSDPDRGDSQYVDLQFTFPLGKHGFDITYQNYSGFYIEDEHLKDLNGGEYVTYPDLAGALIEFRYYYAFNINFSMKSAFNQTARQLKNAGSWLLGTSVNAFIVSQGGGFIPSQYQPEFAILTGLDAMVFTGIGISGGYAYTWVYSNDWFFTPAFLLGLNFETQTYYIAGGEYTQQVPFNPKTSLKLSVGRHKDSYYYGASLVQNNILAQTTEHIQFSGTTFNLNFYYGIRL